MTKAEAKAIDQIYGRGFASLRVLAGYKSQTDLADDPSVPIKQPTISEIERGDRALKTHEIEFWLAFFADRIEGYDEARCWDQLRGRGDFRPHLRLVEGGNQPPSTSDQESSRCFTDNVVDLRERVALAS